MKNEKPLKKLLNTKGIGLLFLGVAAGIILLMMPSSGEPVQELTEKNYMTGSEYCSHLEEKTQSLIMELPNVKDCTVFITLEKGYKYIYATDQHVHETSDGKETDKTIVLAGNGNGESPIIIEETMPSVAGVAVVCPNATYETQYKIVELISALYNIPSNRISVQT